MIMFARMFTQPTDINSKEDDFLREDLMTELYTKSKMVAVSKTDKSIAIVTEDWLVLGDPAKINDVSVINFRFISRTRKLAHYMFMMNVSSLKSLGDILRKLPRFDMNDIFNVTCH